MKQPEKVFKALGDLNRLRILNVLLQQETCVCDLQSILALPQPLLSRHLAYLRNCELVQDHRDGPRVFYSLTLDDELGDGLEALLLKILPLHATFQGDLDRMRSQVMHVRLSNSSDAFSSSTGHSESVQIKGGHHV